MTIILLLGGLLFVRAGENASSPFQAVTVTNDVIYATLTTNAVSYRINFNGMGKKDPRFSKPGETLKFQPNDTCDLEAMPVAFSIRPRFTIKPIGLNITRFRYIDTGKRSYAVSSTNAFFIQAK